MSRLATMSAMSASASCQRLRPSNFSAKAIDAAKSDGKKSVLVRVKSNDGEHYLTLPTRAS